MPKPNSTIYAPAARKMKVPPGGMISLWILMLGLWCNTSEGSKWFGTRAMLAAADGVVRYLLAYPARGGGWGNGSPAIFLSDRSIEG